MDALKNALKNRKSRVLNISIDLGEGDKEREKMELGLAPDVEDVSPEEKEMIGGPGVEQGDEGMPEATLETEPTMHEKVAGALVEGGEDKMSPLAPGTLRGKVKSKLEAVINKKKA